MVVKIHRHAKFQAIPSIDVIIVSCVRWEGISYTVCISTSLIRAFHSTHTLRHYHCAISYCVVVRVTPNVTRCLPCLPSVLVVGFLNESLTFVTLNADVNSSYCTVAFFRRMCYVEPCPWVCSSDKQASKCVASYLSAFPILRPVEVPRRLGALC